MPEIVRNIFEDYCKENPHIKDFGLTASTPQVPFSVSIARGERKCDEQGNFLWKWYQDLILLWGRKKNVPLSICNIFLSYNPIA